MYGFVRKISAAPALSGCGGCAVKSEGNCTSHLTAAAAIIAQGFVEAKIMFNRLDPEHVAIVTGILAEDIRDDKNGHVVYDIPKEPKLQEWFFGLIAQRVAAGLNANTPSR
ncbi:MAG: hypothetical protein KGI37_02820 [Alphaproteobacteria bacterium]|nr:hypothetical protein [Alphaproteobacteria bacterium]